MRFGSWVDCLRERALKYVKNLTTSPMLSVLFFIPNCARFHHCHSSQNVTHLSDSQWHCHGHKCIFTQGKQTPSSYRAGRTDLQLHKWSWASQIEMKGMQTSELWGSLNLSFLNSQALWLNTHLNASLQFRETGNNIFIISILQMVELKHCKVYWLTQSCTACLNGSRTPAGLIPTPGLLAVTLSCICAF